MAAPLLLAFLRFETPGYLALFALLPLIAALSIRSLSGLGPTRRFIAILARCAVVALMVLALAGAQRVMQSDELNVILVVDRSQSIPRSQSTVGFNLARSVEEFVRPGKDRFGIVVFNGSSAVEQLPMGALSVERLSDPPVPDQTNIAAALRMATALFTDDAARRIVLVTDGNETAGLALEEADQLAAARVPIDVLPIRYQHENEVIMERIWAPQTATAEETIKLNMALRAQKPTSGRILLYHNDELVDLDPAGPGAGYPVDLPAGATRLEVPVPLRVAGAHRFHAVFEPNDPNQDEIRANNEGRAFTIVSGMGRVLILTSESDRQSAELLAAALAREKLLADVEAAGSRPLDQVRLLEYSAVILSNVARNEVTEEVEKALAVYVRELGGGLIMVGGDQSFGAGGWMGSPVEDVMPVSFDVKSMRQIPKGALVLVMHACEIPNGNYWGERVAIESVRSLSSRDLVGILQYQWRGGAQGYWLVPLGEVGNKSAIIQTIRKMDMGDLPDFDAIMRPGVEALVKRTDAAARHMIIVSDFDPAPPADDLLQTMVRNNITCSTVAIGFGGHPIDVNKAQLIARVTGGKYYSTEDPQRLPQIFLKESQVVRRSLINERRFQPRPVSGFSALLGGIPESGLPPLDGYVLTTIKDAAQTALIHTTTDGDDPILAHWQVGLGKTVAFTSGMWPRWGAEWAPWPGFSRLWAQVVRWCSRQSPGAAYDVSTTVEAGKARIRLDALDKNAAALSFMTVQGSLIDPALQSTRLALMQTGPGQYEAEFDASAAGNYLISLQYSGGTPANPIRGTLQTGLSIAFSPEFRQLHANEAMLSALPERTGGRTLAAGDAAKIFDRSGLPVAESRRHIWEDLIRYMLFLFIVDVAVRRIAISPIDLLRRARQYLAEMGSGRTPAAATSGATLSTLKGTRDEVREGLDRPAPSGRYPGPADDASRATQALTEALGGASEKDAPVVARPTRKPPTTDEAGYTSRLLKAKKQARQDMSDENQ